MKKGLALFLSLLMVLMMFCSCGNSGEDFNPGTSSGGKDDGNPPSEVLPDDMAQDTSPSRKIIKTYKLELETLEYDKAIKQIVADAEALGGYISNSSEKNTSISESSNAAKYATYTVRIPSDKTEEYIEFLSEYCNILRSSLSTEDITDSYYSYTAQLESLKLQEERLTAMLKQANTLDYMITLENKLVQVRAEINAINTKLQLMDKSVTYSYIYINLSEVQKYQPTVTKNYWGRLGSSFTGALNAFVDVLGGALIVIVWLLPFLITGGVIAIIVIKISRHNRKKKQQPTDNIPDNQNK